MKTALLKYWLPKLATWLAGNSSVIVGLIQDAINTAETKFPRAEGNSHRAKRLNWVRDRAATYLQGKSTWAVNVVIEMLVAYSRVKSGGTL